MDDLLRSISWHAEKQFRRRGRLDAVIWVTEAADGVRNMFETPCTNAPDAVTDAELLAGLANDTALDFAESGNIARFSVAYLARRVTVIRPVDPASTMQPTTTNGAASSSNCTVPPSIYVFFVRSFTCRAVGRCSPPRRHSMIRALTVCTAPCCSVQQLLPVWSCGDDASILSA